MLVATFGPNTQSAGKSITYEGQTFVLEGRGPITAGEVLAYDREGLLQWAYEGLRDWTRELAALTPAAAAEPKGSVGVGGFIWSLVGFVFPPAWIVGLVMSREAMKVAADERLHGGLALAGFIISVIGCALLAMMVLFLVVGYTGSLG